MAELPVEDIMKGRGEGIMMEKGFEKSKDLSSTAGGGGKAKVSQEARDVIVAVNNNVPRHVSTTLTLI